MEIRNPNNLPEALVRAAVGDGDFFPKTDIGKIFTMFYQFIGIPFFVYTTSLFINKN